MVALPNSSILPSPFYFKSANNILQFGNPELNGGGGWGLFNTILGWQNSATYGSVISYNVDWIAVILCFLAMRYSEVHGHWRLMKLKEATSTPDSGSSDGVVAENFREEEWC